ncbi:MAG: alkyl hydroperoxide reductase [Flavobacteriaceae bacterium]|nr:alkyl hydroperoxide reductase [Flavobacteriaceae bacterium]
MRKRLLIGLLFIFVLTYMKSQQISMDFSKFAGKSYDFIIFQGDHQELVHKGIIPNDGKFILNIPAKYGNYIGMSRWLITGTSEGGGLDMFIPGHDFSVICTEALPNEKNIIYTNNTGNANLNTLYKLQEGILSRYQSMQLAIRSYDSFSKHYSLFKREFEKQRNDYAVFQEKLRHKSDYISSLLSIINITRGMSGILSDREEERSSNISQYISQHLDWNTLYTSGYWTSVIEVWVGIHTNTLKDQSQFISEFKFISDKIQSSKLYTDFCGRVLYYLKQYEKKDYIGDIIPIVNVSGKYDGSLLSYIQKQ